MEYIHLNNPVPIRVQADMPNFIPPKFQYSIIQHITQSLIYHNLTHNHRFTNNHWLSHLISFINIFILSHNLRFVDLVIGDATAYHYQHSMLQPTIINVWHHNPQNLREIKILVCVYCIVGYWVVDLLLLIMLIFYESCQLF